MVVSVVSPDRTDQAAPAKNKDDSFLLSTIKLYLDPLE